MGKPLTLALLGSRGIPARYGGFETFAEELSVELVARGHSVTVFCRDIAGQTIEHTPQYRGVDLRYSKTIGHKYLETPLHALTSNLALIGNRFDAALLCNAANSPFSWMIRLCGIPFAVNVDGIERERAKWNAAGRAWYRLGEASSVWFADTVVGDAQVICDYYRERYGCEAVMIPYGARATRRDPGATLEKFNLEPKRYVLYVSRLEPENNALGVIKAYRKVTGDTPLVIVGDAPYASEYKERLRAAAQGDHRVIFTGFQFGAPYQELQTNCLAYVQATEVGGTHPALIEAMAYGNPIIANGTPENHEVLGEAGLFYSKNDFSGLSAGLQKLVESAQERERFGALAKARAEQCYSWKKVADDYERLFYSLVGA